MSALIELPNSYVPSFQQHLNIMRSTNKMLTSDFVELEVTRSKGSTESLRNKSAQAFSFRL